MNITMCFAVTDGDSVLIPPPTKKTVILTSGGLVYYFSRLTFFKLQYLVMGFTEGCLSENVFGA